MADAPVMRVGDGGTDVNTLILRYVCLRFQIAPGTEGALGIEGADYTVSLGGRQLITGTTTADGEVRVPVVAPEQGVPVLTIFGTDYNVSLHPGIQGIDTVAGQQKRLEHLGYLTGYQLTALASAPPDDNADGPRTQQGIMNFQTESALRIDGDVGAATKTKLRERMGGV